MPSLAHFETVLQATSESYALLPLQGDASLLMTQRGGRVAGLFTSPASENLLWTNPVAFHDAAHFAAFKADGQWNLGGERLWIAPEIQYNVRNRQDFWGTLHVPPAMDPAAYRLECRSAASGQMSVSLDASMALPAYNLAVGQQELRINRVYSPVDNPVPTLTQADVTYCGYQQQVTLSTTQANIAAEAWNLMQLKAGGHLLIPCMPQVTASDYFGSVPDEARLVHKGTVPYVKLHLTGKRQYKVGYQSASISGRMGYWHPLADGHAALLIRSFFNNPSNPYAEEPPDQVGQRGHSVHVYNDGGEFGGNQSFGEMECTGTTLGGDVTTATDTFLMWVYVGQNEALRPIAQQLLGVSL